MAAFCEGCPVRLHCEGDIRLITMIESFTDGQISADGRSASFHIEDGNPTGPTTTRVVYSDDEGGRSKALIFRGDSAVDALNNAQEYVKKISGCSQPDIKRFLGLTLGRRCAATQA